MHWVKYRLGDIVSAVSGQVDPAAPEHKNRPYVGPHNIEPISGKLVNVISAEEARRKSGMYEFDSSHVLYCKIGPMQNKVAVPDFDGICGSEIYPLIVDEEKITREFLAYSLRQQKFLNYVSKHSNRAVIPKMNRKMLFEYVISIPHIDEQKRIVKILDKAEELKFNSEQSKFMRQSLIRSKFVNMFEKDIENATYLPLEQICKIVDCPHSTPQYSDEPTGYYCVRSQDLTDEGELIFDKMMQVTRDTFENRISRHTPKAGDVLFLREGSIGRCAIIPNEVEICLGQRIMILSPDKNIINPSFLHYLILSDRFQHSLSRFKLGTTAGRVNIKDLRGLLIPIPELSRQIRFQKFVNLLNEVPYEEELFSILSKSITQEMLT